VATSVPVIWVHRFEDTGSIAPKPNGGSTVALPGQQRLETPVRIGMRFRGRSTSQLERLALRLEARAENCSVEGVLKAIAHGRGIIVLDAHIKLAHVRREESHDLAIVGKLSSREYYLVGTFLIEFAEPRTSFDLVHNCLM
jgi:hypothetical protein